MVSPDPWSTRSPDNDGAPHTDTRRKRASEPRRRPILSRVALDPGLDSELARHSYLGVNADDLCRARPHARPHLYRKVRMSWLSRLKNHLRDNALSDEIAREMHFHLAERAD